MNHPSQAMFSVPAIEELVHAFYERVQGDALLSPVFATRITDWDTHLDRMTLFWRAILRGETGYRPERGSPRMLHAALDTVTHEHYARWLELFEATATQLFDPPAAQAIVERARRMSVHLSAHLEPSHSSSQPRHSSSA